MSTWTVSPLHVRMLFIFDTFQSLLANLPSRLPLHTLHTHMHIHCLPDEQYLIRTLSFAPPSSFLHTPAFPSSPSLLSPFSAPLTTAAAVIHLMKHREIFEGFSPHISLFPLLLFLPVDFASSPPSVFFCFFFKVSVAALLYFS